MKERRLERKEVIANPVRDLEKQKGLRAAELLLRQKPDVVVSRQPLAGKSPEYVFESARIMVRITDAERLADLIGEIEGEVREERAAGG